MKKRLFNALLTGILFVIVFALGCNTNGKQDIQVFIQIGHVNSVIMMDDRQPFNKLDIFICHCSKHEIRNKEAVLEALDAQGLRPANLSEVLAYNAQHEPERRTSFYTRIVGYLYEHFGVPKLFLDDCSTFPDECSCFPAIRK